MAVVLLLTLAGGLVLNAKGNSNETVRGVAGDNAGILQESVQKPRKSVDRVWKRRSILYLSYGLQTIEGGKYDMNSDFAVALLGGRTFYLHKKPIGGVLKFGIDALLDFNFAKYPDLDASGPITVGDYELPDLGIMQAEAGIGIGPSIGVRPVGHLLLSPYFHVVPSFSAMIQNEEGFYSYSTFFNVGLSISIKAFTLGAEYRWNSDTFYKGVTVSRSEPIYDENGVYHDPFGSVGVKMNTGTARFFIGVRF